MKHQVGVPGRVPRQAQGAPQAALKQVPEGALETHLEYPSNSNSNFESLTSQYVFHNSELGFLVHVSYRIPI